MVLAAAWSMAGAGLVLVCGVMVQVLSVKSAAVPGSQDLSSVGLSKNRLAPGGVRAGRRQSGARDYREG
jgi:hypothetical protein